MPVPIGILVGDLIATAKLLKDLRNALRQHDGAHIHHQSVIRDLETCDNILSCLENSDGASMQSAQVNAIRALAHSIRERVVQHIQKFHKYGSSLDATPTDKKLRRGVNKLKWSQKGSKTAAQLSEWISMQMANIQTPLELHST
jgi:hypothetical protein